ncbi:MAG TPA: hypothetical protein VIC87_09375, partial [Vicinamibacteria bacterium]
MTTTPGAVRTLSPFEAAREAARHTRSRLFPIRLGTWFVLGFLAFLDQLGRTTPWGGGGGAGGGEGRDKGGREALELVERAAGPDGRWSGDVVTAINSALAWLSAHATLVILGGLAALLLGAALVAAVLWINARGTFMYLDAVTSGRVEVRRPWREHARRADSYFGWSLGIVAGALLPLGVGVAVAVAVAIAYAQGRLSVPGGVGVLLALVPLAAVLFLVLPLLFLARIALRDFVAPIQLATGVPCGEAVRVFETLLLAHPGAFALYLLLKVVLWVGTGIVVILGGCLTCCVGFLPIVMQTLFQPLFYFERAWSVFLL